jgi:hypothetical protein
MSSHREAPAVSQDPVADNTDLYAFVSPDNSDTVTLIANYIPLQEPAGGPNFFEFGDDVLYEIHVDNDNDARADITYQFRFSTTIRNTETFLYNTGPIAHLDDTTWNRPQTYSVTKVDGSGQSKGVTTGLKCPPCNIGPFSTPTYTDLANAAAAQHLHSGERVFAGQRAEGFYVDLGSIFDLGDLRPIQQFHFGNLSAMPGVNTTKALNVHSIAIQVPKTQLTRDGSTPTSITDPRSTIGVWASASRRKVRMIDHEEDDDHTSAGPWVQVSRLGNPLINEVVIPMGRKDQWNSVPPADDKQFVGFVTQPGLAALLPVLYPNVFPSLEKLVKSGKPRADLEAILMTGIPPGIIKGFTNFTGSVVADMLRLNTSIKPASKPNIYGLLGGDAAGFPNGRRIADDVVAIELRAIAGVTYPLIDPKFKPDAAAGLLTDGLTPGDVSASPLGEFPYLGVPYSGFNTPS